MVILLVLMFAALILTTGAITSQTEEIGSLRRRVENLEVLLNCRMLDEQFAESIDVSASGH
jgi:hypothetical protein